MSKPSYKIGLFSMILLCVGGIVGSGLFLLPGTVASICGNWALVVYLIVALIVMAIAWCCSKCASAFSRNGGGYLYAKEAFGDFIGFEIGIMRWVVGLIAWASLTVGFVTALGSFSPIFMTAPYKQLLIVGIISGLGLFNLFGVRNVNRFNSLITFAKLVPLFLLVLMGFFFMQAHHFVSGFSAPATVGTLGSAALVVFYAFGGFDSLPTAASDMKDPKKNLPIAIMVAIFITSLLYFVVQAISIGILGPDLMGSQTPLADAAEVIFGPIGKLLVGCAMLLSIGGIIAISSYITPRACQAMAEEGSFFPKFFQENRFGSPQMAILISVVLTCIIALSGNFVQLATISVVSRFAGYITTCLSLYVFEKRGLMTPFERPWKRLIPLFAIIGMVWLIMQAAPYQLLWGFGALVLGVPLYYLHKKLRTMEVEDYTQGD